MENKILMWLRGFAPFAGMMTEFVGSSPGCCGLFPRGQLVVSQNRDLLGGGSRVCRRSFLIRLRAVPGASAAALWEELEKWLAANAPPSFGEDTTATVKNARLESRDQTGTAIYEATLELTYREKTTRGKTSLFRVNGQDLILPDAPVEISWENVDDPASGRDESGLYHRFPLRRVCTWRFRYHHLTEAEKVYLDGLFPLGDFLFTYPDKSGSIAQCYCYREKDVWGFRDARGIWQDCSFSVVQR